MGLHLDEAIHHLHPRSLELRGPLEVLLFLEPRLELDHRSHRFARLGGIAQRADHRSLLARAVQRLLDRQHIGIAGSLAQERQHHVERFIRVVDDDVFFADRGEAIAIVFAHPFGKPRRVRLELQRGQIDVDDLGKVGDPQQAIGFADHRIVAAQFARDQAGQLGRDRAFGLEPDHPATTAAFDRAAEIADEVFGFFLDLDVAVAHHPERGRTDHLEPGEQRLAEIAQHRFQRDEPRRGLLELIEPRQRRWQHDQFAHRLVIGLAVQLEQDRHPQIGDERKRMRRIERLRGDDRQQLFGVKARQFGTFVAGDLEQFEHANRMIAQRHVQLAPQRLLIGHQRIGARGDQRQLLRRGETVDRAILDAAQLLALESRDANHEEFVEIGPADRQEPQPFEQRAGRIIGLGQNAAVELQPAQLTIEKAWLCAGGGRARFQFGG